MDKRTVIALIVIAVIFIFYDDYLLWLNPPQENLQDSTSIDTTEQIYTRRPVKERKDTYLVAENESLNDAELGNELTPIIAIDTIPEEYVNVETNLYKMRFTNKGAKLISCKLKSNGRYLKETELELLKADGKPRPGFRFWSVEGPVETDQLSFTIENEFKTAEHLLFLKPGQQKNLVFTSALGNDRSISVVYRFNGDTYTFEASIEGSGLEGLWGRDYGEVYWRGGLRYTESKPEDKAPSKSMGAGGEDYYSEAHTYFSGNELEDLEINKKKDEIIGPLSGQTLWGSVRTKYFMAALIPEGAPAIGCWMESIFDSTADKIRPNNLGVGLRLPLDNTGVPLSKIKVYVGPIDYDILNEVEPTLKLTMNWGWAIIAPFSKAVLWSLKKMHVFIPNYGICIILFSILIKIVVWPLTRKSYRSMAAMQQLQPKMKELREKYKSDPQRMQKETMKLYKEEKVNPMGGCLPMLIQMPLLYSLFIIFRATIQFRNAPFVFWITDLSKPDIIFHLPFTVPMYGAHVALLPILMGISTFFQSKSTMTDPNQKMMLYIMPVFMTLIFNQFPSGLTLYYTLFNVLTLVQQRITPPPKLSQAKAE
ncbi:membrane protein insertase YidC [bacterium]|nr:membrane protein insertase YidC [bacterium]